MSFLAKARAVALPKLHHFVQFVTKQGSAMVGNLIYGLLCVRLLPVSDYAKFAVLFGYMGSVTVLLDTGITGTLAPLVGEQIYNLELIANYVASIRRIIGWIYLGLLPVTVGIFILLVQKQHWGSAVIAQMIVVLMITAWFARVSSTYGAVVLLRRDREMYYRIQLLGSFGSLALLALSWAFHFLNLYVCILLNMAQIIFIAAGYYRRARHLLKVKGHPSRFQERAILRLALPNVPGMVFYAIQGQITIMLITVFGHNSTSVADIGALNRLGQILVFFSQMNPILVEPYFAKLPASRVKRTYFVAIAIVSVFATAFCALAFLFPEPFLWILGPNYRQLRFEAGLVVLGSSIRFISGFMWTIHSSRRFVYWWNSVANIALTILVQAAFLWKFELSQVSNVLMFNIASGIVGLVIAASCGFWGFWRGPQTLAEEAG